MSDYIVLHSYWEAVGYSMFVIVFYEGIKFIVKKILTALLN